MRQWNWSKPYWVIIVLVWLLGLLCLTSCGTRPTVKELELVVPQHDESLRRCKPRPPKPSLDQDPSAAVAGLIVGLAEAHEDCESKLAATWESIDQSKEASRGK